MTMTPRAKYDNYNKKSADEVEDETPTENSANFVQSKSYHKKFESEPLTWDDNMGSIGELSVTRKRLRLFEKITWIAISG